MLPPPGRSLGPPGADGRPGLSRTLVKRVSRLVDRHASRRGFLRTSAMTATAVAVAPVAFAIRPTTAEAAIVTCFGLRCNAGDYCCDGWTEFCCRITGENTCPPGTVVGGWWKVDNSDFCSIDEPRPRYYIDCNLVCDPGCSCGYGGTCHRSCTSARCRCPDGCGTRKSECLRFRYGQCNQDVCVGAISCRVVTCVPPWQWDAGCETSPVLRNEFTRRHDLPCLHEGFNDVAPNAHYAEAVRWVAAEGIVEGLRPDLFGPEKTVSRGQFSTFLWRYSGEPVPASVQSDNMPASLLFDDVPRGSSYADAVAWMVGEGITAGKSPRQFAPDEEVTRAQAVVFLHRLAGSPPEPSVPAPAGESDAVPSAESPSGATSADSLTGGRALLSTGEPAVLGLVPLPDTERRAWYADALDWAVAREIVWWYPGLPFEGDRPTRRSEVAALLHHYHLSVSGSPSDENPESDDAGDDEPGDSSDDADAAGGDGGASGDDADTAGGYAGASGVTDGVELAGGLR